MSYLERQERELAAAAADIDGLINFAKKETARARKLHKKWITRRRIWDEDQRTLYLREIEETYSMAMSLIDDDDG